MTYEEAHEMALSVWGETARAGIFLGGTKDKPTTIYQVGRESYPRMWGASLESYEKAFRDALKHSGKGSKYNRFTRPLEEKLTAYMTAHPDGGSKAVNKSEHVLGRSPKRQ
jgi:hypothetical protein